jgi:hypothetical protein
MEAEKHMVGSREVHDAGGRRFSKPIAPPDLKQAIHGPDKKKPKMSRLHPGTPRIIDDIYGIAKLEYEKQ